MCKIDIEFSPDCGQSPVGSIKHGICGHITIQCQDCLMEDQREGGKNETLTEYPYLMTNSRHFYHTT